MNLHWCLFTSCASQEAALKVAAKHFEKASIEVGDISAEPYYKGGFKVSTCSDHLAQSWSEFVVLALALAQNTGHGWILTGSVTEELNAWSNLSVVSGISSIHVQAIREV